MKHGFWFFETLQLNPDPHLSAEPSPRVTENCFCLCKVHPCRTAEVMTELMSKAPLANYIAR